MFYVGCILLQHKIVKWVAMLVSFTVGKLRTSDSVRRSKLFWIHMQIWEMSSLCFALACVVLKFRLVVKTDEEDEIADRQRRRVREKRNSILLCVVKCVRCVWRYDFATLGDCIQSLRLSIMINRIFRSRRLGVPEKAFEKRRETQCECLCLSNKMRSKHQKNSRHSFDTSFLFRTKTK